jgi:hypothetical protein
MSANFSVQFRINEKTQTRVIRLTDTSSGLTLAKGNFSVTFPDGSTRIKTDWTSPDITSPAAYIDILAVTDNNNNVITGSYKIDFIALDAATTSYSASKAFDFNWVKPSNGITDLSDVLIPQVQFSDVTSYSPIGSFTGTPTRVFSTAFPTTSEASAQPATTTSSSTLTPVYTGNYYEGVYNVSNDITCNYTHTSNSWLTINYIELFTKTVSIKKCPTQLELIGKINTYRGVIEAYKEKNDTQFNILSEQYDLAIALYSHIIARYQTGTQDGSEGQLRELLSILEPYTGSYTYQSTKMLQFELASSGANSFNISDGTNTDSVALGSSLLFSSGNAALVPAISNNQVSYSPIFGSSANTFAQGNDSRFHNAVTIGTANGLSLASQVLSLALATSSTSGAFSASDKAKLDGIAAGANTGTVTSVAVSVPSAFSVTGSPVTTSGTINISATGNPLQYITGAGALATLNTSAVPELTNLYFTNARARAAISATGSLSYNSTTGVISYTTPTETDPVFTASAAYGISSTNISNWNTAYGWGNHALAGYLTAITSGQVTGALGYTPENAANKGIANGYASLDGAGLVPSTQLPSYVDDVLEYADLASFPATGTTGKIYVDLATNKIYRWSGTIYVEISSSAGGGGTWGSITGTLSNQTDLQSALDAKQNSLGFTPVTNARTLTINGVTYDLTANRTWTVSGTLPSGGTAGQILSKIDATNYNTQWIDNFANQLKQDVKLGAALSKGTPVYVSDANGTNIIVSAASNTAEVSSSKTMGLLETGGILNDIVKVVTEGFLSGLDTSAATIGNPVWLGAGGTLLYGIANKPVAPAHLVFIGIVTRVHAVNGEIFIKVQNGFELEELHNVLITSVANNEGLFYDSATSLWKNKTIAAALGYTPYNAANPSNYIALTALSSTATGLTYTNTTGVFSLTSGYVIPTTTEESNWNTAYGWGNHASAGYLLSSTAASTYQPLDGDLTAIAALAGTSGFLKKTAANTWSLDTNTYLTSYTETDPIYTASSWYTTINNSTNWNTAYGWGNHASAGYLTTSVAASTYQPLDADLTAIAGLVGTSGFLKKTAANTWSLDTNTYLTSYTETDPIYTASSWYTTTNNSINWNTAYGWGNHASAGYLTTSSASTTYVPLTRTLTINGTAYDLSANRSWTISGSDATKLPLSGGTLTGDLTISKVTPYLTLTNTATGTSSLIYQNGNDLYVKNSTSGWLYLGNNRTAINGELSVSSSSYFTGTINTYATQGIAMWADNCYLSGWNGAGNTRYGYLQFTAGSLNLFSEAGAAFNLGANGTTRIYVTAAGNIGMGTTSPLSPLHITGDVRTTGLRLNTHTTNNQGHRIYSRTQDVSAYATNTSMRFTVASGYDVQFQYEVTFHATRLTGTTAELWYLRYTAGVQYATNGYANERWWDLREQAGNGIANINRNNQIGYFEINVSAWDTADRITCVVGITCNNWDAVTVTFP